MRAPPFTRSLRFRVSLLTSTAVFGLGALGVAAIYAVLLYEVRARTVVRALVVQVSRATGVELQERTARTLFTVFGEDLLGRMTWAFLMVLVALFVLSFVVSWLVAGRALKPVDRITQVAQEIEATDLGRRIDLHGPDDELNRMAATFDAMLDRLDEAFQGQRRFVAQTSHDLRNPLSVIRSNLEVTMSDPDAGVEEWRGTGEIVGRAAERMSVMLDDLLAAARLEAQSTRMVILDLAAVVTAVAEEIDARAREADTKVVVRPDAAVVRADHTSLVRAVGNLTDNALRLAPGDELTLASGTVDGWGFLAVADRGPGFGGEAPSTGRSGMGLEIVRRIAALHGGTLAVGNRPEGGAVAVIWLPLASGDGAALPSLEDLPAL